MTKNNSNKKNTFKKNIFSIVICIVIVSFIMTATNSFFPKPNYENFCSKTPYQINVENCSNYTDSKECFCNEIDGCKAENPRYDSCQKEYSKANDKHSFQMFLILNFIGIILIIGSLYLNIGFISNSVLASGGIIIFIGTTINWSSFNELGRLIMLGLILGTLIFIAIKKLKD